MSSKIRFVTLLMLAVFSFTLVLPLTPIARRSAEAATGSGFKAGNIIADGIFFNRLSMDAPQIQAFLESKVPSCDTNGAKAYSSTQTRAQYGASKGYPAPYTCLKNYSQNTPSMAAESGLCNAFAGGGRTAAQIISDVSVACGINPQVLLVLLQKEQSLVSDDWPWPTQYTKATGFGCPDTAPCDSSVGGFFYQVYYAARQFRKYARDAKTYSYLAYRNNNILYNPSASCGSSTVYVENQATAGLYNYTPYQPNAAALANLYGSGDSCSAYGNRNFWRMFTDWFGSTWFPYAFRSSSSDTIYINVGGYKIIVPQMGILQDYGISADSIQTVSQSSIDALRTPASNDGISSSLSYLVKSPSDTDEDGGSIYLISVGKRYQIKSMQQLADFGYSEASISYMPLGYVLSMKSSGFLSNYISTPYGTVFQVANGQKRLIPSYKKYIELDPSDDASYMSYFTADLTPAGQPITDTPILLTKPSSQLVYLYDGSTYLDVPTYNAYACWGFDKPANSTLLFRLPQDNYIASPTVTTSLKCNVSYAGQSYILDGAKKYTLSPDAGDFGSQALSAQLFSLISNMPISNLERYVKESSAQAVWYLDAGKRRVVPTYNDFMLLKADQHMTVFSGSPLGNVQDSGFKLGNGSLVKNPDAGTVFTIFGDSKIPYNTSDSFMAYRNSWDDIRTYPTQALDSLYPTSASTEIQDYYHEAATGSDYLVDSKGCYIMNSDLLARYGHSSSAIQTAQTYDSSIFPNLSLSTCKNGSRYAKVAGQSLVYLIESGQKRPINTWNKLEQDSGTSNPYVISLSSKVIDNIPTGAAL
jgi:hypothetical protein